MKLRDEKKTRQAECRERSSLHEGQSGRGRQDKYNKELCLEKCQSECKEELFLNEGQSECIEVPWSQLLRGQEESVRQSM